MSTRDIHAAFRSYLRDTLDRNGCATCPDGKAEVTLEVALGIKLDTPCWVCRTCARELRYERSATRRYRRDRGQRSVDTVLLGEPKLVHTI